MRAMNSYQAIRWIQWIDSIGWLYSFTVSPPEKLFLLVWFHFLFFFLLLIHFLVKNNGRRAVCKKWNLTVRFTSHCASTALCRLYWIVIRNIDDLQKWGNGIHSPQFNTPIHSHSHSSAIRTAWKVIESHSSSQTCIVFKVFSLILQNMHNLQSEREKERKRDEMRGKSEKMPPIQKVLQM